MEAVALAVTVAGTVITVCRFSGPGIPVMNPAQYEASSGVSYACANNVIGLVAACYYAIWQHVRQSDAHCQAGIQQRAGMSIHARVVLNPSDRWVRPMWTGLLPPFQQDPLNAGRNTSSESASARSLAVAYSTLSKVLSALRNTSAGGSAQGAAAGGATLQQQQQQQQLLQHVPWRDSPLTRWLQEQLHAANAILVLGTVSTEVEVGAVCLNWYHLVAASEPKRQLKSTKLDTDIKLNHSSQSVVTEQQP